MESAGSQAAGQRDPMASRKRATLSRPRKTPRPPRKDLADAQQQLAQRKTAGEMDLAFEQLSKIKDALVALKAGKSRSSPRRSAWKRSAGRPAG